MRGDLDRGGRRAASRERAANAPTPIAPASSRPAYASVRRQAGGVQLARQPGAHRRTDARPGPAPRLVGSRTDGTSGARRELDHDPADQGPQVDVLVGVEVVDRDARSPRIALELRAELAPHVVGVDASRGGPGAGPCATTSGKRPPPVDQGRDLAGREQRRVLADHGEVRADAEARGSRSTAAASSNAGPDREHRGRGDDAVAVCAARTARLTPSVRPRSSALTTTAGSRRRRPTGRRPAVSVSSARSPLISLSIVRITAGDDSVDTPRVRGK